MNFASIEVPPERGRASDLSDLAARGRISELRILPDERFSHDKDVAGAVLEAARNGRSEVLAFFELKGVVLRPDELLKIAAAAGRREVFSYFNGKGHSTISPDLIDVVLRQDRSNVLKFWLQNRLIDADTLVAEAVRKNAALCFYVLANVATDYDRSNDMTNLRLSDVPQRIAVMIGQESKIAGGRENWLKKFSSKAFRRLRAGSFVLRLKK